MLLGERLQQLVVVPVLAPEPIAYVGLAFEVDDAAAREARRRVRRLAAPSGRVLVAVCDPTSHRVRRTTYQERVAQCRLAHVVGRAR